MGTTDRQPHSHQHAFGGLNALEREGLAVVSRRNMLKAGLAGMAGLSLPALLRERPGRRRRGGRWRDARASSCCGWPAGRATSTPGTPSPTGRCRTAARSASSPPGCPASFICEHLPKQAAMLDKFTIIRSVDARHSNHEPNTVFQTGNLEAEPRTNPRGATCIPAIGSIVAKHHGAEPPGHAALRRVHEVAVAPRLRRLPGQAVRPVHRQPGRAAADLHQRRRRHRPDAPRPTCSSCRAG